MPPPDHAPPPVPPKPPESDPVAMLAWVEARFIEMARKSGKQNAENFIAKVKAEQRTREAIARAETAEARVAELEREIAELRATLELEQEVGEASNVCDRCGVHLGITPPAPPTGAGG